MGECCETTSLHQEISFHEVISSIQAQDQLIGLESQFTPKRHDLWEESCLFGCFHYEPSVSLHDTPSVVYITKRSMRNTWIHCIDRLLSLALYFLTVWNEGSGQIEFYLYTIINIYIEFEHLTLLQLYIYINLCTSVFTNNALVSSAFYVSEVIQINTTTCRWHKCMPHRSINSR